LYIQKKPETIEDYKIWLAKSHNTKITEQTKNYYISVANTVKVDFESSQFWTKFTEEIVNYNDEFSLQTQFPLIERTELKLQIKSFDSFLEKTFRINVINNKNWPEPPQRGWVLENNWFTRINDIVRTLVVVKYLDGVDFMLKKIVDLCVNYNLDATKKLEAREDGYYAAHIHIKKEFEIPKRDWDTIRIPFIVEVQITTQLQEVIRKLLHRYYENKRRLPKLDDSWKWDYRSNEFATNYLGHILHYIEGMIVEARERQKM
jgi:hypothetical protein